MESSARDMGHGAPSLAQMAQVDIPNILDRYELKYTVPVEWVEPISDFIRPYCFMDRYSAACADGFYRVNSLYLDSPELCFLRAKLNGSETRFNMRIRTYGDDNALPCFAEIKHKTGDTIRKTRAVIRDADLESVLLGPPRAGEDPRLQLFRSRMLTYNAHPWVQTRYLRKAFISHCDEYARVTFDRCMEYAPRDFLNPVPVGSEMIPSDEECLFDPGTNVVLELKCYTAYVPSWMIDLIRSFGLNRRGFSKYSAGLLPLLKRQGYDIDFSRTGTAI